MTNTLQHTIRRMTTVWGLGFCVLASAPLQAADVSAETPPLVTQTIVVSDEARWYQVNVLIFSQTTVVERNPELWPNYPTIDRSVPPIKLTDIPVPVTEMDLINPETGLPFEEDLSAIDTPFFGLDESPAIATATSTTVFSSDPLADSALFHPYEKLPEAQRYLNPYAERLARDRRYKVLFHESWIQPIESATHARPIIISGGYHSGLLDELSGLINISISRYLHVNTQIYLTDIVESSDPFDLLTGQKYSFVPLTFSNPLSTADLPDAEKTTDVYDLKPFELKGFTGASQAETNTTPDYFDIPATYAVAVSSVLMEEKRRMRSKELHYIDNPKMGMLIYFTPFDVDAEPADLLESSDEGDALVGETSIDLAQ